MTKKRKGRRLAGQGSRAADVTLLDRPLSARSVIASLLLGMHPPRLAGARLVQWCGLFGIAEGTARVALSRMVDRGELRSTDAVYELAGRVRARQPAQDWSLTGTPEPWSGQWWVAVVVGAARPAGERAALRDAMRRLRCAAPREGVWCRPANLPEASAPADAWQVARAQCEWWTAKPDADDRELAARLFQPEAWAARAGELRARLGGVTEALARGDTGALAPAFVAGAAALAHIRADPMLPPALCPAGWPGDELRSAYHAYQEVFAAAVRDWFRTSRRAGERTRAVR